MYQHTHLSLRYIKQPFYGPIAGSVALCFMTACQQVPLDRAHTVQSYSALQPSDGLFTKSLVYVDKPALNGARRIFIVPTTFSKQPSSVVLASNDRKLITNAIDRSLCANLSEKFEIVGSRQTADLTVRATVSHLDPTDEIAAGASRGLAVVPMVTGVPAPIPRIPYGLGSLTVEAEALDARGTQRAGMIWARGADVMASSATVSNIGDAYRMAGKFGEDFGDMLVKGESPFGQWPSMMSQERINLALGLAPKYSACEVYGRGPGIAGAAVSFLGAPPNVTDGSTDAAQ